jgi:hypothetical protein
MQRPMPMLLRLLEHDVDGPHRRLDLDDGEAHEPLVKRFHISPHTLKKMT